MQKFNILSLLLIVAIFSTSSVAPDEEVESGVNWISFEKAIELNKENPKKLLIDLYTDWCGWCKVMDRETYSKEDISTYINENFYPVKFNAEQRESVEFDGHTFKFIAQGRRGVHELAAALTNNKLSYPTTVFMDEKLRIISPVPGYLKPQDMEPLLSFIVEEHYKDRTKSYQEYKNNYKSSL